MNNKSVVLDSSALLALIQEERGSEIIKPLLKTSVMSAVNVAEVLNQLARNGVNLEESISLITDIIPSIVPFDFEQAGYVASLQSQVKHKVLSLGDRACIGLGIKLGFPVYTADKVWGELGLGNIDIRLIR